MTLSNGHQFKVTVLRVRKLLVFGEDMGTRPTIHRLYGQCMFRFVTRLVEGPDNIGSPGLRGTLTKQGDTRNGRCDINMNATGRWRDTRGYADRQRVQGVSSGIVPSR